MTRRRILLAAACALAAASGFTVAYAKTGDDPMAGSLDLAGVFPPPRTDAPEPAPDESGRPHPDKDFLETSGLAEQLDLESQTGWLPYTPLADGRPAFVPSHWYWNAVPGDVIEAVDGDGEVVGYAVSPGLFAELDEWDTFDWEAGLRTMFQDRETLEGIIDAIDARGGPGDVQRVADYEG